MTQKITLAFFQTGLYLGEQCQTLLIKSIKKGYQMGFPCPQLLIKEDRLEE